MRQFAYISENKRTAGRLTESRPKACQRFVLVAGAGERPMDPAAKQRRMEQALPCAMRSLNRPWDVLTWGPLGGGVRSRSVRRKRSGSSSGPSEGAVPSQPERAAQAHDNSPCEPEVHEDAGDAASGELSEKSR